MNEETEFMKGILPTHYTCEPRDNGVHCHSQIGIKDTFKASEAPDDHWELIMKAIKQKFGGRFMEVFSQVSTRHSKFTVFIKPVTG